MLSVVEVVAVDICVAGGSGDKTVEVAVLENKPAPSR